MTGVMETRVIKSGERLGVFHRLGDGVNPLHEGATFIYGIWRKDKTTGKVKKVKGGLTITGAFRFMAVANARHGDRFQYWFQQTGKWNKVEQRKILRRMIEHESIARCPICDRVLPLPARAYNTSKPFTLAVRCKCKRIVDVSWDMSVFGFSAEGTRW